MPRTGSSWFYKIFLKSLINPIYKKCWDLFQSPASEESPEKLNLNSTHENPRPEIQKTLSLTSIPNERLLLSIHQNAIHYHVIMDALLEKFPNSLFLWHVRDGRDIVDSMSEPVEDHWPQETFGFLGESREERFKNALKRFIDFSRRRCHFIGQDNEQIHLIRYEEYTEDFVVTARSILDKLGIDYDMNEVQNQADEFDARHGMWQDWEDWKKICLKRMN